MVSTFQIMGYKISQGQERKKWKIYIFIICVVWFYSLSFSVARSTFSSMRKQGEGASEGENLGASHSKTLPNQCMHPTKRTCKPSSFTILIEMAFLFFLMDLINALLVGYITLCTASGPCPRTAIYSRMLRNAWAFRKAFAALIDDGRAEEVASPSSMMRDWRRVNRQTSSIRASGLERNLMNPLSQRLLCHWGDTHDEM